MNITPYHHEVKYYECDGMGITHHSNYVRFMEEARVDWMDQLGYGFDRMEAEGVVSPVVSVECRYRKPTKFKDIIDIVVTVLETTPLKIVFAYTMSVSGKVVCTAQSTHCFLEQGRPVSLQQRFPELYNNIIQMYPVNK
jgi:acyl-CoA thioester hydrolase